MNDDDHKPGLSPPAAPSSHTVKVRPHVHYAHARGDGSVLPRYVDPHQKSTPDSSYQSYLFGKAGSDEQPAWSDSIKGRAAIRMLSRGVVGAVFFTIGGRMARSQLKGYQEHHWKWDSTKPLQAIAKGIDATLGRGIKATVRGITRLNHTAAEADVIAKNAVTFRQKRKFYYIDHHGRLQHELGRSYGSDIVSFTFDFAMASVGDALTRNVIQAFDPNIKKTWLVNDHGDPAAKGEHKHIVWGEALKAFGRSGWRIFSKNQGEDWAAAIPYAFQMKFQRQFLSNILEKRFDGHKLVFDQNWNGGAYRLGKNGKIIGDYQLVGAMDLHARFVGYNWYTLMFREAYDRVGNFLSPAKNAQSDVNPPSANSAPTSHSNPITATIDGIGGAMRYVTKSFIKANMYMNPAVIPFWLMRTSQSKWRGQHFIEGETGALKLGRETNIWSGGLKPYDLANYQHYSTATRMDRFEKGFSQGMNWLGDKQFRVGKRASKFGDWLGDKGLFPQSKWFDRILTYDTAGDIRKGRRLFMHELTDASFSYTPYMFAKAECGLRVDDSKGDGKPGEMDKAIYGFMNNVAAFNIKGTGQSLKQIWKLGTNFERDTTGREGGADPSPTNPTGASYVHMLHPAVRVHTQGLQHDRPNHGPAINDNGHEANDNERSDKNWVQSIVGKSINPAQLHSASATRH